MVRVVVLSGSERGEVVDTKLGMFAHDGTWSRKPFTKAGKNGRIPETRVVSTF
jgi:hypothetical protein